ncbi:hypothetical protein ColLi_12476 [Colletotrichum liriopes]|uniref:Uncharacterized protein n=1 Tax=Colletotrichum liriopes TaxID=708192 RepID=A0AA37GYG9_9PEZI|nr:hypothetical protein ColLi_12476 [Colletotrichum liriopes]
MTLSSLASLRSAFLTPSTFVTNRPCWRFFSRPLTPSPTQPPHPGRVLSTILSSSSASTSAFSRAKSTTTSSPANALSMAAMSRIARGRWTSGASESPSDSSSSARVVPPVLATAEALGLPEAAVMATVLSRSSTRAPLLLPPVLADFLRGPEDHAEPAVRGSASGRRDGGLRGAAKLLAADLGDFRVRVALADVRVEVPADLRDELVIGLLLRRLGLLHELHLHQVRRRAVVLLLLEAVELLQQLALLAALLVRSVAVAAVVGGPIRVLVAARAALLALPELLLAARHVVQAGAVVVVPHGALVAGAELGPLGVPVPGPDALEGPCAVLRIALRLGVDLAVLRHGLVELHLLALLLLAVHAVVRLGLDLLDALRALGLARVELPLAPTLVDEVLERLLGEALLRLGLLHLVLLLLVHCEPGLLHDPEDRLLELRRRVLGRDGLQLAVVEPRIGGVLRQGEHEVLGAAVLLDRLLPAGERLVGLLVRRRALQLVLLPARQRHLELLARAGARRLLLLLGHEFDRLAHLRVLDAREAEVLEVDLLLLLRGRGVLVVLAAEAGDEFLQLAELRGVGFLLFVVVLVGRWRTLGFGIRVVGALRILFVLVGHGLVGLVLVQGLRQVYRILPKGFVVVFLFFRVILLMVSVESRQACTSDRYIPGFPWRSCCL